MRWDRGLVCPHPGPSPTARLLLKIQIHRGRGRKPRRLHHHQSAKAPPIPAQPRAIPGGHQNDPRITRIERSKWQSSRSRCFDPSVSSVRSVVPRFNIKPGARQPPHKMVLLVMLAQKSNVSRTRAARLVILAPSHLATRRATPKHAARTVDASPLAGSTPFSRISPRPRLSW